MNFFRSLYRGWMKFANILGRINTRIILTIFYFIFISFYSIPFRIYKLLKREKPTDSFWIAKEQKPLTEESLLHLF